MIYKPEDTLDASKPPKKIKKFASFNKEDDLGFAIPNKRKSYSTDWEDNHFGTEKHAYDKSSNEHFDYLYHSTEPVNVAGIL